ncbi:Cyclic nucleotide-binding domain [Phytophthora infestans]|uniref:Cyclic nucleotide-binding domain n=1 Tax=Phytophthora infestans TaxID=4787 RepID=A0A8S9UUH5_PHYIN|nr:Cyclic nucleotide-binding domain [Phytophthora infestans]
MAEGDSPLPVDSAQDHAVAPVTNVASVTASPLRRMTSPNSRRHTTHAPPGVVYPIAEVAGEGGRPHVNARRRSVSSRGIAGTPASGAPPAWATLSSSLRRSVSDIRGHIEVASRSAVIPPKETPYEEMMERFQIRQLQRMPSSMAVGVDGLVSDFVSPPSTGVTARTPRSQHTEHYLHQRPSSRNVSEQLTSSPEIGLKTASFRHFGDTSTFIGGGHPPLESGVSESHLMEQFNLANGDIGQSFMDTKQHDTALALIQRTLHMWERRLLMPISPYSRVSQARYAVILVATVAYVLWFPLGLAFPGNAHTHVNSVVGIMLGFDVLISLRTGYVTETGVIVLSSWQILWHYLKTRLIMDILVAVSILVHVNSDEFGSKWMHFVLGGLSVERLVHITRFVRMIWLIRANQTGTGSNFWAWLLYSRYSHLFRIAGIVVMVVCIAHYIACIWTILLDETEEFEDSTMSWGDKYAASFYAALLLIQGEGVPAETAAQNLFASLSVVLGSIVLAVVFGHVAILVSNFNANATSYQRKMEEVLAMTAKLQLPVPLRERIHEYYEHLWHEYECLDGEIVQFSKSLSHSLGLEVVLFKYMEVVMHVPFWKDCTPDFQKQLMLHLDVRVYLPNDFIMRQGEVDVEFYMVNRGYCELDRDSNRFERVTTTTLATGRNGFNIGRSNSMTARRRSVVMNATQMNDTTRQSAYELDTAQRRYYLNGGRDGKGTEILISRGQAFGDMALLMNYQRAANVRAVTHVEMCVLAREKFQTVLAKYPEDRRRVVVDMLTSYMQSYEVSKSHCPLLELVRKVYSPEAIAKACAQAGTSPPLAPPALTVRQAAERIYTAINKESNDPTLKFGVGVNIRDKLLELRERRRKKRGQTQHNRTEIPKTESRNRKSSSHFDRVGRNYSETKTAVVETSTMEAPTDPNLTHTTTSSSLQHRLQQLEEREVVILQGLKDLQASLEVLRSRPTTTTHFSRKRLAPGDDSTTTKPPRIPLLRRVGSFVASGGNPDTKSQGQGGKDSPTRYADKLFGSQNVAKDREPPRYQISRANDSFRFTSEIEPPLSTIESLPVDQPPRDVVVSDRGNTVASERHPASFQPTEEVVSLDNNPRILFQRMASRSLRKLEVAVQSRSDAIPVARASIAERRATFQRTHSQSLRTMADALKPQQRPRPSMTSTQTRVLKRMSSFVSEGQLSNKRSPTRYADELFRRKSMMAPDEEGWEPK